VKILLGVFMNRSYKGYAFLLAIAVVIACPAQGMDNAAEVIVSEQTPVVWYKKESTQKIASVVIVASVLAYIIAMHMNKIASPVALFTALFCLQATKVADNTRIDNTDVDGPKNDGQKQENQTNDDVAANPSVQTSFVQENQLSDDDKGQLSGQQVNVDNDEVGPVDNKGDNQPEQNLANQLKPLVSFLNSRSFFHKSTEADFDNIEKDLSRFN